MTNNNTMHSLETNAPYGIGVDIGGTKMLIHIADMQGDTVYKKKVPATTDYQAVRDQISDCLNAASIAMEQIAAIGFGVPGITDSVAGIVIEAPAFHWTNEPFLANMQPLFDKPVFINNDVNCAALGERWKGAAQGTGDFVFIAIGTGVGSAIVTNGSLVQGSNFMAGEIAYMVVDEDTVRNDSNAFGQFGVFEKKTSGVALSQHGVAAQELFVRYGQGEAQAVRIIERFVADLSIGIANIVSLLNPQKIIVGGGVSRSMPVVLESIRAAVAKLTPVPATIELSALGEDSGAIGAAAFALEQAGYWKGAAIR